MGQCGDLFTGTPNLGFGMFDCGARDWRIGWRLTSAVSGDPGFEDDLDATRREAANDPGPGEACPGPRAEGAGKAGHGVMPRSLIRR